MNELAKWSYLYPALFAGLGVAFMAGPLGAIMVWRRLAYFGDTLSHSGLLGVTLALVLHLNVTLGVALIALLVAGILLYWQKKLLVASDALLGILSHVSLALGLITLSFFQSVQVDVLGFLYGDILAVSWHDVAFVYIGGIFVTILLIALWPSLLRIIIDADLAQVEGVPVEKIQKIYVVLLAIVVAIAIKIVGVLLITALLIIPAAAARVRAKTPEQMAIGASIIGMLAVFLGLLSSHVWDIPTGPAIVMGATILLLARILVN